MSIDPKDMVTIGVYGTLKRGFGNHNGYIASDPDRLHLGYTKVPGIMVSLGAIPMLVDIPEDIELYRDSTVMVELWKISKTTLGRIDGLEGHPNFYERKAVNTSMYGEVWVYYGASSTYLKGKTKIVRDGDWQGETYSDIVEVEFGNEGEKPRVRLPAITGPKIWKRQELDFNEDDWLYYTKDGVPCKWDAFKGGYIEVPKEENPRFLEAEWRKKNPPSTVKLKREKALSPNEELTIAVL